MILNKLYERGLITCPKWLLSNTHYLVIGGSVSYGTAGESSDWDLIGFCIPHKDDVFPHLRGEIIGFGRQKQRFEQFLQHHIFDEANQQEYDIRINSIVKFFKLCMDGNPDCVDILFAPQRCILHSTRIGELVRANRKLFLHKGCYHKLKGYAYQQMHKMKLKNPQPGSKREELVEKYGFDVKFAVHVYRLMSQCEEILTTGNLTLDETGRREVMKAILRGEWTINMIEEYFQAKEVALEKLYNESDKIPYSPDENKIRAVLFECLKLQYGSLDGCVSNDNQAIAVLRQIDELLSANKSLFDGAAEAN